jgi:hypothetical protein
MLSSPLTHARNFAVNAILAGVKPVEKALSGGIDYIASKIIKERPRQALTKEGALMAKEIFSVKNLMLSTKRFKDVLTGKKFGVTSKFSQGTDIPLTTKEQRIKRPIESTMRTILRALKAGDEFFTPLLFKGERAGREYRQAQGLSTGDIDKKSLFEAKRAIFNAPMIVEDEGQLLTLIGTVGQSIENASRKFIKKFPKSPLADPVKHLIPYVKIPTNMLKKLTEYSPYTGIGTVPGAKRKTDQIAKWLIGSTVFMGANQLMDNDRLIGDRPRNKKQREYFESAGYQPFSIRITDKKGKDKFVSLQNFDPVFTKQLIAAATLRQALKDKRINQQEYEVWGKALALTLSSFSKESYIKNVGEIFNAVSGDETAIKKVGANIVRQYIPFSAFVGWINRGLDEKKRRPDEYIKGTKKQLQYMMLGIPGLSKKVAPVKTPAGTDIEYSFSERMINMISPLRITKEKSKVWENLYKKRWELDKVDRIQRTLKEMVKGDTVGEMADPKTITRGLEYINKAPIENLAAMLKNQYGGKKLHPQQKESIIKEEINKVFNEYIYGLKFLKEELKEKEGWMDEAKMERVIKEWEAKYADNK